MSIHTNINGAYREMNDGWVNINGVWRQIDSIYNNINGAWKEGYSGFFKGYVALGDSSKVALSANGVTWQVYTTNLPNGTPRSVHFYNGLWVCSVSSIIYYSKDCINWTLIGAYGSSIVKTSIGLFAAAYSSSTTTVYKSTNGLNWSSVDSRSGSANYTIGAGSNGTLAFVNSHYGAGMVSSDSGATWHDTAGLWGSSTGGSLCGSVNGVFFAAPEGQVTYYPSRQYMSTVDRDTICNDVAYGNGRYVFTHGGISSSPGLINKSKMHGFRNFPIGGSFANCVIFANGYFYVGGGFRILRSNTGDTADSSWTSVLYDTSTYITIRCMGFNV